MQNVSHGKVIEMSVCRPFDELFNAITQHYLLTGRFRTMIGQPVSPTNNINGQEVAEGFHVADVADSAAGLTAENLCHNVKSPSVARVHDTN